MARHIDAHLHLPCDGEVGLGLLADLDLKLVNVCVPKPEPQAWRRRAEMFRDLACTHPERFAWIAGFDLPTFDADEAVTPGYADRVIDGLEADFAAGAVGVKIWKNVGMEVRKPSGEYLMIDDPLYEPIYGYLTERGTTLLLHIGEPRACWMPLDDPEDPHHDYYRSNPEWHFHGRRDVPSYEEIIAARDRVIEGHPDLRIVGAHLASLEWDVAQIAQRLDRFPNFAVDTSARLLDLARQDREAVRAFFERYGDRILFGTDIVDRTPWSRLPAHEVAAKAESIGDWLAAELAWYGTDDTVELRGRAWTGLGLSGHLLGDVLGGNARRWYPGV